jgi:pilus assembly protein TadC
MGIYKRIAALLPVGILEAYRREIRYVGLQVEEKRFVGFVVIFGLGIAIAAAVNLYIFFKADPISSFVLTFGLFGGGIYFWLSQTAEREGQGAEKVLPDVLELIASNIKSGLTTEKALFASARPEFGVISEELKNASKEIISGARMEDSLMIMPTKIKSRIIERSIWLLVQGMKSGGAIADLLIQLSSDLREENAMKQEVAANISMYVLLIFAAALFGAPLLFGISSLIVGLLVEQTGNIGISPEQMQEYSSMSSIGRFMGLPTVNITEPFIVNFAVMALIVTALFASLTIGAMASGSEKRGIKYIPLMLIGGLGLFFLIRIMLGSVLGSLGGLM